MSDENIAVETGPETVGETGAETVAETPTESYEYVDTSAFDGKYVKVKVDGEELDVPFSEAIQGYQRQADYTRKTQELSQQREQLQYAQTLQQALESNPQQTLEILSRHYGVAEAQRMIADAQDAPSEPEFDDPLEKRIWETEQRIQQYEQERANDQLQREIVRLQNTYEDFNPQEVVRAALNTGTTNLEAVYKQIAYDRLIQKIRAGEQANQIVQNQNQQVVDAKRDASFVEGGASANGPSDVPVGKIGSVHDAWALAKQQMGM
jgi:hypothetical protein